MSETIDLSAERAKRRAAYVNRERIEALLSDLDDEVHHIAIASEVQFGAIDVLAHEIAAFTSAIRRALQEQEK